MLASACALGAGTLSATEVLVITDRTGPGIDALSAGLTAHGLHVVVSPTLQAAFDGSSPSLAGFQVVVHVNGSSLGEPMPFAGQQALDAFVRAGGGFVQAEWNALEYSMGYLGGMRELTLFDPNGQMPLAKLPLTAVAGEEGHPVLADLPFALKFSTAWTGGIAHPFSSQPVEVLMRDAWGNDAVATRAYGSGRIVGFEFAARGDDATTLGEPLVQQLYANAVRWASGHSGTPTLALNEPQEPEVAFATEFFDPGATAWDADDGDLTNAITVSGAIDTRVLGAQTLTYSVSDSDSNRAMAVRTVHVVDVMPPTVVLRGASELALALGAAFIDEGALATDDHDGDVSARIVIDGTVDTAHAGTYRVIYAVSDASGNAASAVRVVTVYAAPVVACSVSNTMLAWQGGAFSDVGLAWTATSARSIVSVACSVTQDEKLSGTHDADLTLADGLPSHLWLRNARQASADGRVYLVRIVAIDDLGQTGSAACTVTVPKGGSAKQRNDVLAQAAADLAAGIPLAVDSFGMPKANG
jgi:hypothetical protein